MLQSLTNYLLEFIEVDDVRDKITQDFDYKRIAIQGELLTRKGTANAIPSHDLY